MPRLPTHLVQELNAGTVHVGQDQMEDNYVVGKVPDSVWQPHCGRKQGDEKLYNKFYWQVTLLIVHRDCVCHITQF